MTGSYSLYRCAVLSTSTGMLDSVLDRNSPIDILRLSVHMNGQSYADGCSLKPEEFSDWMRQHPDEMLSTSPPQEDYLRKTFLYLKKQGYHEAIVTAIGSKLSESFNIIRSVAEEMASEIKVHVFDTGINRKNAQNVLDMMLDLKSELGTSLIVVTHDDELASRFDRVMSMGDGNLSDK